MTNTNDTLTLEQRKTIYRARRGLKELDFYFSPYVKHAYLAADAAEQALFGELIAQEDPDLLDWFLYDAAPPNAEWAALIAKIKHVAASADNHG
ncbi:hypothetical protein A9308_04605 [Moraxella atlantae]|uniref:FAD assembly factor SdhE n=1 Tax=Faucicola atlantae TaxID=34059 RepID=A0A1B8QDZ4_9GAMM|nr:succinate dehydrogenase assembly factor 2 [Moraxella atlantae]OBX79905.1 hypothetical protein A9308_04605 [Moraxella atlantae]